MIGPPRQARTLGVLGQISHTVCRTDPSDVDATVNTVGPPLSLARTYHSRDAASAGAFGAGWTSLLDMSAIEARDQSSGAVTGVVVTYAQGLRSGFAANGSSFVPAPGQFATLNPVTDVNKNVIGYALIDKTDTTWTFTQARANKTGVYGLASVTDSSGRVLNLTWTGDAITKATTASGRSLTFTWTTPGTGNSPHIASVTTDPVTPGQSSTALVWNYTYTGDQLTKVCPPISTTACTVYGWSTGSHYPSVVLDSSPHSYWRFADVPVTPPSFAANDAVLDNENRYVAAYSGNATFGSTPSPIANGAATAASFDGTSSWVTLPNDPAYNLGAVSFSMWFKTTGEGILLGFHYDPITNGTTPGGYIPALYVGNDGKLHGQLGWTNLGVTPMSSSVTVTDGKWHQAVITAANGAGSNAGKEILYLDGAQVSGTGSKPTIAQSGYEGNSTGFALTVGTGFIGGTWPAESHYSTTSGTGYADWFKGSISDLAVHTRPLTPAEIATAYAAATAPAAALLNKVTTPGGRTAAAATYDVLDDRLASATDANGGTWTLQAPTVVGSSAGLVGAIKSAGANVYWRMGETAATQAVDEVTLGDYANYDNVTEGQTGPFGAGDSTAVAFDGATSDLTAPTTLDLADNRTTMSIGIWFNTTKSGILFDYANSPLSAGTATSYVPALYIGTDGNLYGEFWNGAVAPISSGVGGPGGPHAPINDGKWHYAVLAAGGGTQTLFLDGLQTGNQITGPTTVTGDGYDTIGAGYITGSWPAQPNTGPASIWRYTGNLAEFAYYQNTLTPNQVQAQWQTYNLANQNFPVESVTVLDPTGAKIIDRSDPGIFYRPLSHVDAAGGETTISYDTGGNLATVTDPDGYTAALGRDARANVITTNLCADVGQTACTTTWITPHAYTAGDPANDKAQVVQDPNTSTSSLNSNGTPTDTSHQTTTTYVPAGQGGLGQPYMVTTPPVPGYPNGQTTTTTYTDANTPAADSGHPPIGLVATVADPAGGVTSSTYYADGDLATTTSPLGLVTRYTYDGLGRVLTSTAVSDGYPNGLTTSQIYDGLGRVLTRTDPAVTDVVTGVVHTPVTTAIYDADGNQTSSTVADSTGGDPARTTSTGYDSAGRPQSITDPVGATQTFAYDVYGDRTSVTAADGTVTVWAYDTQRRLVSVTLKSYASDATHTAGDLVTESRAYDPDGRLGSVTDAMGRTDTYTYRPDGKVATIVHTDSPPPKAPAKWPYKLGTCQLLSSGAVDNTHCFLSETDTYDNADNLTGRTSNNGATVLSLTPDANGRDAQTIFDTSTGGLNRTTAVVYDATGNPIKTTVSAPGLATVVTEATYDVAGNQLTQVVHDVEGDKKTVWTRDKRGLAVSKTDPLGNVTTYLNDEAGHQSTIAQPAVATESGVEGAAPVTLNPVTRTGYDTFGDPVSKQDANGNITITGYDGAGRDTSTTKPAYTPPGGSQLQPVTTRGYDGIGRLIDEADPAGNHTTHTYDQLGDLLTTTAPGAAKTVWTYDSDREQLSQTTAAGALSQTTWNFYGQKLTDTAVDRTATDHPCPNTSPAVACYTTSYSYLDSNKNLSAWVQSETSPAGVVTSHTYKADGQLAGTTDGAGNTTSYAYDQSGRQISETAPDGTIHATTYDYSGNMTGTSDSDHTGKTTLRSTSTTWDLGDRRTTAKDAAGNTTTWTLDATGIVVAETQPVAAGQTITTGYAHDPAGNATRFTDGRGNPFLTTWNTWNLRERRIEPSTPAHPNPTDRTWTSAYDLMGRLATVTAPGGVSQANSYDVRGNLTKQTGAGAEASTVERDFGYDNDDQLISASAPGGSDTFTWNDRGKPVSTSGPSGTATFTYNPDGNMTARVDAAGTSNYTWDAAGRLAAITDAATATTQTLTYDSMSHPRTIAYGTNGATRNRTYDDLHRLTGDTLTAPGGATEAAIAYGYDNNDNETAKNTTGTAGAGNNTYSYDQVNRLTSWNNGTVTTNYAYDASGNRTGIGARTQSFDARNRLTSTTDTGGTTTWTWTARGTLASTTGQVNRTVASDAFDQIVTDTATAAGAAGTQSYGYDALGRQVSAGPSGSGSGPANTLVYSGLDNQIAADSGTRYALDPDGQLVATRTGTAAALSFTDQHHDVTAAFTATGTALTASAAYDPLGRATAGTGTMPGQEGYQGGWTDPATAQVDMWHRRYDPLSSGFDSRDSTDPPGANAAAAGLYTYGQDSPLDRIDPTGQVSIGFGDVATTVRVVTSNQKSTGQPATMQAAAARTLTGAQQQQEQVDQLTRAFYLRYINDPHKQYTSRYTNTQLASMSFDQAWGDVHSPSKLESAVNLLGLALFWFAGEDEDPIGAAGDLAAQSAARNGAYEYIANPASGPLEELEASEPAPAPVEEPAPVGCSFAGTTPVLMADGTAKPIQDIHVGDKVTSTREGGPETDQQTVTAVTVHHDSDLLDLTVRTGNGALAAVHTTAGHQFWDETTRTWTAAAKLVPGQRLHTADGTPATVDHGTNVPGEAGMWDLTVETSHTFYVIAGSTAVLVHNVGCEAFAK